MIIVIDSGGANIASILFSIERLGAKAEFSHDPDKIKKASHVILPGVGFAKSAMQKLHDNGLYHVIRNLKQPVLGICLGMQLLFDYSEEGEVDCLQIIPGRIKKLSSANLPVPHMGWNKMTLCQDKPIIKNIDKDGYVYFVHSYYAPVNEYTVASSDYGQPFSAIVQNRNFYGMQFHPERSSQLGETLIKNFLEL